MARMTRPSLILRIGTGKIAGFAIGLAGMMTLPLFMPEAGWMLRWGILFWYTTLGAVVGLFGVFNHRHAASLVGARTGLCRPTFARRWASNRPPTCTGAPPPDVTRMERKRSDVHRPIKGFSPAAPGRHAGSGRIGKPDRGGPAV